jgi:Ni/Fe-hydrogenase subunit HybB-like protein
MSSYITYWRRMIGCAFDGSMVYYLWILFLLSLATMGAFAYFSQIQHGLIVTNLSDQVSWGAYIANFTFLVGVAAAAVLLIFPVYFLHKSDLKQVVLIGELLAFSALVMCLLFIIVDLGRPDRFLHVMPFIGRLNFPRSTLAWDVLVLNGYLFLNMHVPGYLLYKLYKNETPNKWVYMPFVIISIFWAVSIHTVTAFLYSGLGGRPFWSTAILAPRFLVSAFAGGPALLTIVFRIISQVTKLKIYDSTFDFFAKILMVFLPINMFLFASEVFTEFYSDTVHTESMRYLLFGVHGHGLLRPYIWASLTMSAVSFAIIYTPRLRKIPEIMSLACLMTFIAIWIEKGMGLIVPGFIPSPLGDFVEYRPSLVEFFVSLGIWSLGALIFTTFTKVAISIQLGDLRERI